MTTGNDDPGRINSKLSRGRKSRPASQHRFRPRRGGAAPSRSARAEPPRAPGPMPFADPDYVRSFLAAAGFEAIDMYRETPDVFASIPQQEAEHAGIIGPLRPAD